MSAPPMVKRGTLRWRVLVWACSEPGEWTVDSIADDMGEPERSVRNAIQGLKGRGLLSRGHRLLPTPDGERAIQQWSDDAKTG